MEKEFEVEVKKVFKLFGKENVEAVYLTGSHLNNLATEESDVDLYVVLKQSMYSLVMNEFNSGQLDGEDDFKYLETYKFVQLLAKTNPNMLELLFKYPLYVSESFKPLADYMYENAYNFVALNESRYYSSCYHMLKNNYNKVKNSTGKVLQGKAGKELVNFYKSYYQVKYAHETGQVQNAVELTGSLQKELYEVKQLKSLTEEQREYYMKDMEAKVEELFAVKEQYAGKPFNMEFFNKVLAVLKEV